MPIFKFVITSKLSCTRLRIQECRVYRRSTAEAPPWGKHKLVALLGPVISSRGYSGSFSSAQRSARHPCHNIFARRLEMSIASVDEFSPNPYHDFAAEEKQLELVAELFSKAYTTRSRTLYSAMQRSVDSTQTYNQHNNSPAPDTTNLAIVVEKESLSRNVAQKKILDKILFSSILVLIQNPVIVCGMQRLCCIMAHVKILLRLEIQ